MSLASDTYDEWIQTTAWLPGEYFVAVVNNDGEYSDESYKLEVWVDGSGLEPMDEPLNIKLPTQDEFKATNPTFEPNDIETLFILSESRMNSLYDPETVSTMHDALQKVAQLPGVNGAVFNLDDVQPFDPNVPTMADMYAKWDVQANNPFFANTIARTIKNFITAVTTRNPSNAAPEDDVGALFPNVKYIVLVGGDKVIPFYRVPDMTTFGNEVEYDDYLVGLINHDSALSGALGYRTTLTDDVYGTDKPYNWPDHPLYIPDRAVGRLVEQPEHITHYLKQYLDGGAPLMIDATDTNNRAVVTGYDFMTDYAHAISGMFQSLGINAEELISDADDPLNWTANNLIDSWFDGQFEQFTTPPYTVQSPLPFQSINGHFDHFAAIPEETDKDPTKPMFYAEDIFNTESALQSPGNYMLYFLNRLAFSMGCHSGLNVTPDEMLPGVDETYHIDFPEAFIKQGGNFVGNTGYGYGDTELVAYTERLLYLFAEELGRDTSADGEDAEEQTIGMALNGAKKRYIRTITTMDSYDVKVLMQTTFYGLPFIKVKVPNPKPLPSVDIAPDRNTAPVNKFGVMERVITFTNRFHERVPAKGSDRTYPMIHTMQVEDSFVPPTEEPPRPQIITNTVEGDPLLPKFVYDLTALVDETSNERMTVKDVVFVSGDYIARDNYKPHITAVVTRLAETEPMTFANLGVWYPDVFYAFTSTGDGGEQSDQLLVEPAQYKTDDEDGVVGTMRMYEQAVFKVLYRDPAMVLADGEEEDITPPIIEFAKVVNPGEDASLQSIRSKLVVGVTDPDTETGIPDDILIEATYIVGEDSWQQTPQFKRVGVRDNVEIWETTIMGEEASNLRFIVSATDPAGNITKYTGKGQFAAESAIPVEKVTVTGSVTGTIDTDTASLAANTYTGEFMATVEPTDATLPISYTWELNGKPYETHAEGGITDTLKIDFSTTGAFTVSVSTGNIANGVDLASSGTAGSHVIDIAPADTTEPEPGAEKRAVFLPLIVR